MFFKRTLTFLYCLPAYRYRLSNSISRYPATKKTYNCIHESRHTVHKSSGPFPPFTPLISMSINRTIAHIGSHAKRTNDKAIEGKRRRRIKKIQCIVYNQSQHFPHFIDTIVHRRTIYTHINPRFIRNIVTGDMVFTVCLLLKGRIARLTTLDHLNAGRELSIVWRLTASIINK